ncbi:MAG TPA: hypothetical protein VGB13_04700 [Candidatus Krumholzibacteria bacterium]
MSIAPRSACFSCRPIVERLERRLQESNQAAAEIIRKLGARVAELEAIVAEPWRGKVPVDLVLHCPACGKQHLDVGEFRTRVHRKHLCENTPAGLGTGCGHLWVPYEYATRGVLEVERPEDS